MGNERSIPEERIRVLNPGPPVPGSCILYWMQASVRVRENLALLYAIQAANRLHLPVVAYFGITERFPEANLRHYRFLTEGILAAARHLADLGIPLDLRMESPTRGVIRKSRDAALLVMDRGYLRIQREWYRDVAGKVRCPCVQVEDNTCVPVAAVSGKEEYSAATIRPKIHRLLPNFLETHDIQPPTREFREEIPDSLSGSPAEDILASMTVDRSVPPAPEFRGGCDEAEKRLDRFLESGLDAYAEERNDPGTGISSGISPCLHFGQISPVRIAQRVRETGSIGTEAFLEQLIVRRELAVNFVTWNPAYDSFDCLPAWARSTLLAHAKDPREFVYSPEELGRAETHDPYWNAAQEEMVRTGKMQGYMRMYWGKKILEWTPDPRDAYRTALFLNNRYELDGRDPNGYAGIAWCFGKHDRPWKERPIFGTVRYMNAAGLTRKFSMARYLETARDAGR